MARVRGDWEIVLLRGDLFLLGDSNEPFFEETSRYSARELAILAGLDESRLGMRLDLNGDGHPDIAYLCFPNIDARTNDRWEAEYWWSRREGNGRYAKPEHIHDREIRDRLIHLVRSQSDLDPLLARRVEEQLREAKGLELAELTLAWDTPGAVSADFCTSVSPAVVTRQPVGPDFWDTHAFLADFDEDGLADVLHPVKLEDRLDSRRPLAENMPDRFWLPGPGTVTDAIGVDWTGGKEADAFARDPGYKWQVRAGTREGFSTPQDAPRWKVEDFLWRDHGLNLKLMGFLDW